MGAVAATSSSLALADAAGELTLRERVDHVDITTREPMLAVQADGGLFVSGYPSRVTGRDWTVPPLLWRSDDGGKTWNSLATGEPEDGAQGNSDVDLATASDGTLYFATMGFNRETREGTHITLGSSTDSGASWGWHMLSRTPLSDRPWVATADDGSAYAIWNDGDGVLFTSSEDRGASWTPPRRIAQSGGSSHLAVSGEGLIAVRVSPASASGNRFDAAADHVLVSEDGGATWFRSEPPEKLNWMPSGDDAGEVPRWVSPLAWTNDGRLHHVWSEKNTVHHASSADFGRTWKRSVLAEVDGTAFFPYLTASKDGRLAATWFIAGENSLTVQLALLTPGAGDGDLDVSLSDPFSPDSWEERLEVRKPSPAGEYAAAAFLGNGDIGVVTPIQDLHNKRGGFTFWRFGLDEQAPDTYSCENVAEHRQFDFWLGEWLVTDETGEKVYGNNSITRGADGCLLMEDYSSVDGFTGGSLNYYDPSSGQWHQQWVDNGSSIIRLAGGIDGSAMRLDGSIYYFGAGKSAAFRGIWTPLEDGRVRQFFEQENEAGEWVTWFDGYYRRRPEAD